MSETLSDVRKRAWKTRRVTYGPSGHAGDYRRPPGDLARRALALIVRLHNEEVLSEGQCCRALGLDRISFRKLCDGARP